MTLLERLAAALGLSDPPEEVVDRVRGFYAEVDAALSASDRFDFPCKAGCDACCHESVFLSAPELLVVADQMLREWTTEERRALVAEMQRLADRFEDELLLLEELPGGAERDEVAARVRFRCPFLDSAGCCRVYRSRELNARTFGRAWDGARGHAFGCALTHDRLRVLPPEIGPSLLDARRARAELRDRVVGTEQVHVYPWWFSRYGHLLGV